MSRLLSDTEVSEKVPLSRTQRWRLERAGRFPARIKIGDAESPGGRVAWSEDEINEWIADRMAARKPRSTADGWQSSIRARE